jgi:hypothetical protein
MWLNHLKPKQNIEEKERGGGLVRNTIFGSGGKKLYHRFLRFLGSARSSFW